MQEETVTQQEASLRDYLDLLRRRSAIIIQTAVAALIIGVIVALVSSPVYKSVGRLLVTPPNPVVVARDSVDPLKGIANQQQMHTIETQLQVLTTPELVNESYQRSGVTPGDTRVSVGVNRTDELVDIIDISTEAHKPEVAQDVVNNLMQLFIKKDESLRNGDIQQALDYAQQEMDDSNKAWEDASKKLQDFEAKSKIVQYEVQMQNANTQITQLDSKDKELTASLEGFRASIAKTRELLASTPRILPKIAVTTNPAVQQLINERIRLINERQGKLAIFKSEHPTMKALDSAIASLDKQLGTASKEITVNEKTTNPEIADTQASLRKMEAQKQQLLATRNTNADQKLAAMRSMERMAEMRYNQSVLAQKRDNAQERFKLINSKLADLRLQLSAQPKPISVLSAAALNRVPVRPKRALIIGTSLLAGLFLGICFALLAEFLDDRVNSPEDARRLLNVPALGYIPRIDKEEQRLLAGNKAGGSLLESYRVLRSNVRFAAVGEPLNSIVVTSTAPGEGKSVTACNLAIAMALDGKKVILVDADLRRPTVHEKFGIRNTPGLTNVLVGAMGLDKALQDTEVENLRILTAGPIPPNPAELLNSRAMDQVQEMLKERADMVIFDSPPCLSVADAQVMAASVDGLIYVVQLGSTRKSALRHGNELLRQAHARILGVVYNKVQVDGRRNDYYYGYYSYYHKQELNGKDNGSGKSRSENEWDKLVAEGKATPVNALAEAPRKPHDEEEAGDEEV